MHDIFGRHNVRQETQIYLELLLERGLDCLSFGGRQDGGDGRKGLGGGSCRFGGRSLTCCYCILLFRLLATHCDIKEMFEDLRVCSTCAVPFDDKALLERFPWSSGIKSKKSFIDLPSSWTFSPSSVTMRLDVRKCSSICSLREKMCHELPTSKNHQFT